MSDVRTRSWVVVRFVPLVVVSFLLAFGLSACNRKPAATGETASRDAERPPVARPAPLPEIRLTDITAETGIDVVMTCGQTPTREILEVNGGGLGLFDYDNDDDLDLFVANGATLDDPEHGPGSRLFRNDGGLRFTDVTEASGIALTRWAMGVAVGDVDGNGYDDLYVTCYGPNVLLLNRGDGTFEDGTDAAGVGDPRWGTSAAFGDTDRDGDLDLYVVNYLEFDHANPPRRAKYKGIDVMAGPHGLSAQADAFYQNQGDGTFVDVTESAGCLPSYAAFGLNVIVLDFDHDGWQDMYVGNDSMPNFLFMNQGDGTFKERGMLSGAAGNADGSMQATMGIAVGDIDGNGFADLFTTNFSSDTNTLHLNRGGKFFDDRTQAFGLGMISRPMLGWSCGLFDLDHDGDEDLLMFNGHVYPEATKATMDSDYEQPPMLFRRVDGRFEMVGADDAGPWLGVPHRDRTAAWGDLDRDGDVDVVIGELNGPVRVLRNEAEGAGWLVIRLVDQRDGVHNHRGLGARVSVECDGATQTRWIYSGGGFQSASAPEAHFAVQSPSDRATILIAWPDGFEQRLDGVQWGRMIQADRSVSAVRHSGRVMPR